MVKRKTWPELQDLLDRPICYYCDRIFTDAYGLHEHQKAVHFRCQNCSKRLATAGGLSVHMSQVHKEQLKQIENAMPGREGLDVEIFAMEGYPPHLLEQHHNRIREEYYKMEAQHRARTGNPQPGSQAAQDAAAKKPKMESKEQIKARLAEHKKKRAREKAAKEAGVDPMTLDEGANEGEDAQNGQGANATNDNEFHPPQSTTFDFSFPYPATSGPSMFGQTYPAQGMSYPQPMHNAAYAGSPVQPYGPYASNMPSNMPQGPHGQGPLAQPPNTDPNSEAGPAARPELPFYAIDTVGDPSLETRPRSRYGMSASDPSGPLPVLHEVEDAVYNVGNPSSDPPRQSSLPSVPGLPQKPSMPLPNLSKEDMAKMHTGQKAFLPHMPQFPANSPPNGNYGPPPQGYYAQAYNGGGPTYGAPNPTYNVPNPSSGVANVSNSPVKPTHGVGMPPQQQTDTVYYITNENGESEVRVSQPQSDGSSHSFDHQDIDNTAIDLIAEESAKAEKAKAEQAKAEQATQLKHEDSSSWQTKHKQPTRDGGSAPAIAPPTTPATASASTPRAKRARYDDDQVTTNKEMVSPEEKMAMTNKYSKYNRALGRATYKRPQMFKPTQQVEVS